MDEKSVKQACEKAGVRVVGAAIPELGLPGAYVVAHTLTSPKLNPLADDGFALIPSGPDHTIVAPPSKS